MLIAFKHKAAATHELQLNLALHNLTLKLEWSGSSIFMDLKLLGFAHIQFMS